jgi:hypothetical protein
MTRLSQRNERLDRMASVREEDGGVNVTHSGVMLYPSFQPDTDYDATANWLEESLRAAIKDLPLAILKRVGVSAGENCTKDHMWNLVLPGDASKKGTNISVKCGGGHRRN